MDLTCVFCVPSGGCYGPQTRISPRGVQSLTATKACMLPLYEYSRQPLFSLACSNGECKPPICCDYSLDRLQVGKIEAKESPPFSFIEAISIPLHGSHLGVGFFVLSYHACPASRSAHPLTKSLLFDRPAIGGWKAQRGERIASGKSTHWSLTSGSKGDPATAPGVFFTPQEMLPRALKFKAATHIIPVSLAR
jgi:hypothetical protein